MEHIYDEGPMVGCETAIVWIENLKDVDEKIKERVLRRFKYEFEKDIAVKPIFHKGKYGAKHDYFSCGNCGTTIGEAWHIFCPQCGYRIGKKRHM